jgi:hypothetical protein
MRERCFLPHTHSRNLRAAGATAARDYLARRLRGVESMTSESVKLLRRERSFWLTIVSIESHCSEVS